MNGELLGIATEIWIAVIAAIPPTAAAIWGIRAGKRKLAEIHIQLDGRLGELLTTTKKVAEMAGAERGREEERSRQQHERGNDRHPEDD